MNIVCCDSSNNKSLNRTSNLDFNGLRAGERSPVLRLRQGYGACTLLKAV
jgi:hypothetical protein